MKLFRDSRFLIIASMAIFGTLAPFVRAIGVSSGELALYRAVIASIMIGLFLVITRQKIPFAKIKKEAILLVFSGFAMGMNWVLLFEAYKYTTVSAATLSYYFAPVIVMAVSTLFFGEKSGIKQVVCFVMSTLGIILITGLDLSRGTSHFIGIALGLGAAVLYATVVLLNKFIKNVQGIHRTFLQFIAAIIVLIPYVLLTDGFNLSALGGMGWTCLMTVGILHTGITYCMYFSALKNLSGQKAAILSYIDPLVAVVISVTLLGEPLTLTQALGGILILGFTLYNELGTNK